MSKERKDRSFIKKPVYPGGTAAYKKFIAENLKYPAAALKNKTEGTVQLQYTINHLGKVIDSKVIKGIGDGCDEEAKRIVSLLEFEIPKGPRKLRVQFKRKTQITFIVPKAQKVTIPVPKPTAIAQNPASSKKSYVYSYVPTKKVKKPETKPSKKSNSYTIVIKQK